jgi:hypothetical protein
MSDRIKQRHVDIPREVFSPVALQELVQFLYLLRSGVTLGL